MSRLSPTLEGFRAVFRLPSLGGAEVAWRWSFGIALTTLLGASFLEFLDTLPVYNSDLFLLRTRQPLLVSKAISNILKGSAERFVLAGLIVCVALTAGWILLASVGRSTIVRSLIEYFRTRYREAGFVVADESPLRARLAPLFALNILRVAVSLAAFAGCFGTFILGSLVSPEKDPQPFLSFLVVTAGLMSVWLFWSTLNWYLSLATIFAVRDGADAFSALSAAVGDFRERAGAYFAVGFWFGLAHVTAFVIATSAVGFPLAFAGVLPFGVVFGGVLAVTLLYFAVVDWLHAGRLAAYVAIIEAPPFIPDSVLVPSPPPVSHQDPAAHLPIATPSSDAAALQSMASLYPPIPPSDDDILSDIPGLAPPAKPEGT